MKAMKPRRFKRKTPNIAHLGRFNTSCKFIKDWNDLVGLESDTHRLEIEVEYGRGWIRPKVYANDDEFFMNSHYLSTHTFYGKTYLHSTKLLQKCGFNVVLDNWDKEQDEDVPCKNG